MKQLFLFAFLFASTFEAEQDCPYLPDKVWNDVIFVFDRSSATTNQGLQEMFGHVQADAEWFTIHRFNETDAPKQHMRVGIILYDEKAVVYSNLGSLNNADFDNIDELPYIGSDGNNLQEALKLAIVELEGPNARPNTRKVIVVLATTYRPGEYTDPTVISRKFKEDGGIIVVYNYVQAVSAPALTLSQIASPGYFCYSRNDTDGTCLRNAQSDANCFCPTNYQEYEKNTARSTPSGGCYHQNEASSNQRIMTNKCKEFNNGTLAKVESEEKFQFLHNLLDGESNMWIGCTYDITTKKWFWQDGTQVGTYQPFGSGPAPTVSTSCAYSPITTSINNLNWLPVDCRMSFTAICQCAPCSASVYCEDV